MGGTWDLYNRITEYGRSDLRERGEREMRSPMVEGFFGPLLQKKS